MLQISLSSIWKQSWTARATWYGARLMNWVHCESQSLSSRGRTHCSGHRTWHRRKRLIMVELTRHMLSWWTILAMCRSWAHRIYPLGHSTRISQWRWPLLLAYHKVESTRRVPLSWQGSSLLLRISSNKYRYRRQIQTTSTTKEAQVVCLKTVEGQPCHQRRPNWCPQTNLAWCKGLSKSPSNNFPNPS